MLNETSSSVLTESVSELIELLSSLIEFVSELLLFWVIFLGEEDLLLNADLKKDERLLFWELDLLLEGNKLFNSTKLIG